MDKKNFEQIINAIVGDINSFSCLAVESYISSRARDSYQSLFKPSYDYFIDDPWLHMELDLNKRDQIFTRAEHQLIKTYRQNMLLLFKEYALSSGEYEKF